MLRGAKSHMRRNETPEPIWTKFCTAVDIPDVITYTNFGNHRLRGFWVAMGVRFQTFIVALTTLACECVISDVASPLLIFSC